MHYSVLGPFRVDGERGPIEVRGVKERTLLAHLIASGGRMVPAADLVDGLWGEDPPPSASKSLQTFVLRLRNALEPGRDGAPTMLLTEGAGYRLVLDDGQVDATRFVRLVELGRRSLADGRPAAAAETLGEALAMWRGPAYAGFEHTDWGRSEGQRLEELRLSAEEDRLRAAIDLGRLTSAIPELRRLLGTNPLRERGWELLVLALYRDGRQGEALAAFDEARQILADELGIDPGPGLRALHGRVLRQDPTLSAQPRPGSLPPGLVPGSDALVGRDRELVLLRGAWSRALSGGSAGVTVRGPAGAGATRLVAALAEEVAHSGAEVVLLDTTGPSASEGDGARTLVVADHVPSSRPATLTVHLVGRDGDVVEGTECIDLAPLEEDAVRAILSEYLPPTEAAAEAGRVRVESDGWPGRVHELGLARARLLATRRVEFAVRAADASAASLGAARHDLAEGVLTLRETSAAGPVPDAGVCPWRGLEAYDVSDALWFAGRERLVAELVARLAGSRLVAVVGPSGSGKSSALRAGLLAALHDDALPGSSTWRQVLLRPGLHPTRELSRVALGRSSASVGDLLAHLVRVDDSGEAGRVVLVVDQLEEAWTACSDPGERTAFLDTLAELAADPRSEVTVVLAIRADYVGPLAEHPALAAALADATVLVGSPAAAEVRRAVERPAARAGLVLDDGLADAVVADAGAEPGLLPLLSTALTRLWEHREGRALTFAAYVRMGGLTGAIAGLADDAFGQLSEGEQRAARVVLLRLAGPGEGRAVTRRRVPLDELASLPVPGATAVVAALAGARLLTVSDGVVEVAHEALFREWPLLRSWLLEDASGRAIQRRLAVAASDWDADGRDPSALWAGTRLAAGLEAAETRPEEVTPTERAFLDAGQAAIDEAQRQAEDRARATARQNRRLRILLGGVAAFLVLALVAGLLAWRSRQQAAAAEIAADARRLAASALNIEEPDRALLAAIEATKVEQGPQTYGALLTLLARQPRVVHRMRIPDRFLREAVAPDGRTVFLSMNTPRLRSVDALTAEVLWDIETPTGGQVQNIVVTGDGTGVIVALNGGEGEGGVARLDAATGRTVWTMKDAAIGAKVGPGYVPGPSQGGLTSDGRYLVSTDAHVVQLDPSSGRVVRATPWPQQMAYSGETLVWPDGRISQDLPNQPNAVQVFDPARPSNGTRSLAGDALAASPDGSRVLVGKEAGTGSLLRIVDSRTLKDVTREIRTAYSVGEARWSHDGSRLVWCTDDGFQVVDPQTLELGAQGAGHSGAVMDAWFAGPDGDLVWTAGRDSTAVASDLSGTRTLIASRPADPRPSIGKQSSAGLGVYLRWEQQALNTAHLTDLRTGRDRGELVPEPVSGRIVQPTSVAVTPDGSTAVVGGAVHTEDFEVVGGRVELWDTVGPRRRGSVDLPWDVLGVAITPDGRRAVLNGGKGFAVVDLVAGRLLLQPRELTQMDPADGTSGAEVSPDGRWAALARNDEVVLVDLSTGEVARRRALATRERAVVQALAWTADSQRLAAGTSEGFLHVVDATTLADVAPRRQIAVWVVDLELSRDGRLMASAGSDGDITLWDTASWQPYGQPITDDRQWAWVTFTEDGRRLRAFFEEKEMVDIDITPQAWVAAGCNAAGRNLTADEAAVIVPGRGPRPTCPQLG